jgi:hypothetical protein
MTSGRKSSFFTNQILVVLAFMVFGLCGCASFSATPTAIPAGCEKSVIYQYVPYPQISGAALIFAITEVAKKVPEAKPYIVGMMDDLTKALDNKELTYIGFASLVLQDVKWINENYGQEVVMLSALLAQFDRPVVLDECDLKLLKTWLATQKQTLN